MENQMTVEVQAAKAEIKARKTRSLGTVLVETLEGAGWLSADAGGRGGTVQDAEKWIQENGQHGQTYRICREVLVVTVKHEKTVKVRLEAKG